MNSQCSLRSPRIRGVTQNFYRVIGFALFTPTSGMSLDTCTNLGVAPLGGRWSRFTRAILMQIAWNSNYINLEQYLGRPRCALLPKFHKVVYNGEP